MRQERTLCLLHEHAVPAAHLHHGTATDVNTRAVCRHGQRLVPGHAVAQLTVSSQGRPRLLVEGEREDEVASRLVGGHNVKDRTGCDKAPVNHHAGRLHVRLSEKTLDVAPY